MEIGVEFDPDFGSSDGEVALQSGTWAKLAEHNVKDIATARSAKLTEFKALLEEQKIHLRPGNDAHLLQILRAANCDVKWAIDVAKAFLEYQKYATLGLPSKVKHMIRENIKSMIVLPHRDKYGRRVIVYRMWDAEKFPYRDIMNMFYVISLTLAREPKTQVTGITLVGDMSGMTRKHVASTWSDVTAYATYMKGGAPVWFHNLHLINAPRLFEFLYAMAKPLFNEKTMGNIVVHKRGAEGFAKLHEEVSPDILPPEFGGTARDLDNSNMLREVLKLEGYFQDLSQSCQMKK